MITLIQSTILYMIPLMIVALAGVFAERSGIINIALEGMMIIGAFVGVLFVWAVQNAGYPKEQAQWLLLLAMIVSAFAGAVYSLLLSFSAVNLRADQTIGGTALNMIAPALVVFIARLIGSIDEITMKGAIGWFMLRPSDFGFPMVTPEGGGRPVEQDLGFFNIFFDQTYITTYILIALFVVLSIVLYKTRFGLRLRACGEHPQAADSVGINVHKMRYIGTTISGALAGLGGFVAVLTTANGTAGANIAGLGFLALAVMIFGNWKPLSIALASLFFGLMQCIAASYDSISFLRDLGISKYVYKMIPYIATLVVLAFTSKNSRAPKTEGIPYDKGQR